jgi:hypothetical protein
MKWSDFLRYAKYIAVFYAAAFVIGILGVWIPPHEKWLDTAVIIFLTAAVANICLGAYHYNHKPSMLMAKNDWLAEQDEPQVVASESKELDYARKINNEEIEALLRTQIRKAIRDERGY